MFHTNIQDIVTLDCNIKSRYQRALSNVNLCFIFFIFYFWKKKKRICHNTICTELYNGMYILLFLLVPQTLKELQLSPNLRIFIHLLYFQLGEFHD